MSGAAVPDGGPPSPARRAAAFLVHVFTASGALIGLLALDCAVRRDFPAMFAWLGLALVVDGVDGTFARRLRVAEVLPRWSGEALDLVVDFLTYAVVPAYALVAAGLLPPAVELAGAGAVVVTAALYSADRRMKTDDAYFRGFPAVWNLVAFYLVLLQPPPWVAAAAVAGFAAATFAPVVFVHPVRVRRLRALTLALLAAWSVLAAVAIAANLAPGPVVTVALAAIALYFLAAGLARRAPPPTQT